MNNSLSSDEMIVENINKSLNQLRIYTEQFDLLEEYLSLKNQLKELSKENKLLKKSNEDLTNEVASKNEELANFRKVSYIQSMSKQLTEKDNYIKILEEQLVRYRNVPEKEPTTKSVKSSKEKPLEAPEGYEYFEYNDDKFLKNLEDNKIYTIYDNQPDTLVAVIKKSGKIKFY
jgi:predicted nuclease with TOPRIM domain